MSKKIIKNLNIKDVVFSIFYILITYIGVNTYYTRGLPVLDFPINRTVCGYVLHGINPINILWQDALVPSLGPVNMAFGNTPYGLLLGNLFYFGFLDYDLSFLCFRVLTFFLMFFTIYEGYKYFKKYLPKDIYIKITYYFALFTVFTINILGPLHIGNAGHILCMLLIISIFNVDENNILSGICLALAMTKPQIALPLAISYLFYKKFIPLFIGASIDILASIICSLLVKENIITFFVNSMNLNNNLGATPFYGIFSFFYIQDSKQTVIYSMIFGVVLVYLCYRLLDKNCLNIVKFSYPILIAVHWSYSWSSDYYMITLPSIVFFIFYIMIDNKKIKFKNINIKLAKYYFLLSSFFILETWSIRYVLRKPYIYNFLRLPYRDEWYNRILGGTLTGIIYTIVIISSIFIINKIIYKKRKK